MILSTVVISAATSSSLIQTSGSLDRTWLTANAHDRGEKNASNTYATSQTLTKTLHRCSTSNFARSLVSPRDAKQPGLFEGRRHQLQAYR